MEKSLSKAAALQERLRLSGLSEKRLVEIDLCLSEYYTRASAKDRSQDSARMAEWIKDPALFVREQFGVTPDGWQAEVLSAFPAHQRIAMRSAKGPGKTATLSWLAWYFLATRPQCKIAATSISGDNLADGLWTEMAVWQGKSAMLKAQFEWSKTRIVAKASPETWWMSARTWSKSANPSQQADTLAGLHADKLLFLLDEAGGIPDSVMVAAEAGLATGSETRLVIAGNPTNLDGPLYRACNTERPLWYVVEITGDPDDPKRSPRISLQWAKDMIAKYGKDNPWVLVNVFGRFPPASFNSLLGVDEVRAAMGRHLRDDEFSFAQKRLGVDVSRFGDDRTIIAPRQGLAAFVMAEMRMARSHDVAARVIAAKEAWGGEMEFVDGTGGYGAGVIDALIQAGHSPVDVQFAGKAIDPRYANKRAEIWFLMAEWVKRGGALPDDPELLRELTTPTYTFNRGKLQLEEKEQIKARLGFSPDKADALAVTFAMPDMPSSRVGIPVSQGKTMSEWDPFA